MSGDQPALRPKTRHWRNTQPRLAPEEAARQGVAARVAWAAFENRERAMAFLNDFDESLGGRPLDIAISSSAGLVAVEQALSRAVGNRTEGAGDPQALAGAVHGPISPTD
jgi:uncharacterized protein (DUF2384 family)